MATIGSTMALFGIFSLISRLPSGALYSYRRSRILINIGIVLLAISTLALPLFSGFWLASTAAFRGLTYGMVTTWMLALLMDANRGRSVAGMAGTYSAFIAAGYLVGNFAGGFLVDHLGYFPAFMIMGTSSFFALLPFQFMEYKDMTQPSQIERSRRSWRESLAVLRGLNTNVYLGALLGLYINFTHGVLNAFFPIYALGAGMSMTAVGVTASVKSVASLGVRLLSPLLVRESSYRQINNLLVLVTFGVLFFIPFFVSMPVFMVLFAISGLARGLVRVTSMVYTMEEGKGNGASKGLASGIYNAGLDSGQFLGPLVSGFVAQQLGIPAMFKLLAIVLVVVFLVIAAWEARNRKGRLNAQQGSSSVS